MLRPGIRDDQSALLPAREGAEDGSTDLSGRPYGAGKPESDVARLRLSKVIERP